MADTLTFEIDTATAARLQEIAAEKGASPETVARQLLGVALADFDAPYESGLSDDQLADLQRRLKNPGPRATPERVQEVLAKFRGRD